MDQVTLQQNIAAFRDFFTQNMMLIVSEREIQSGYLFQVNDRQNKISVSLYSTGKTLIQGKECELKTRIDAWWRDQSLLVQNTHTSESSSTENVRYDNTSKFIAPISDFEAVKQLLFEADIQKDLNDALLNSQQVFRLTFHDDRHRVVVTQYQTGTLLVQGW
jgi:ribonuclease HIII